jgi:hypothetical protein
MSQFWDGAGLVATKALKWAAYGAVGLAAISIPFIGIGGVASAALKLVTFGAVTPAAGTWVLGEALINGAMLGGLFGAVKGTADLFGKDGELQDLKDERAMAQQNSQAAITAKRVALEHSQAQAPAIQAENAISPDNVGQGQKLAQSVGAGK